MSDEKLNKKRLGYLLAVIEKNSVEYSVANNSYEIRLIPEIRQACKQLRHLIQQKPERKIEVDEKYIEEIERKLFDAIIKAESINGTFDKHFSCSGKIGIEKRKEFITQVVRDVKGNRVSNDG